MRHIYTLWAGALVVLSTFVALPVGAGAEGGAGSPRAPTMIYNVNDLQNMSVGLGNDFALGNDIDASATSGWNGGAGFQPVGDSGRQFTGTFDGRGYNITKLTIGRSGQNFVGLFGYTGSPAKISNVSLVDSSVSGLNYVGGICGYLYYGTVYGCSFGGTVTGGGSNVGGLVGRGFYGTISTSSSAGSSLCSNQYCGGIAGFAERTPVTSCYSTMTVAGQYETGGLVGYLTYSDLSSCYFAGSVKGYYETGGLVGSQSRCTLMNSYNTGTVQASGDRCGGVTGFSSFGQIYRAWNTGTVNGYWGVGGLSSWLDYSYVFYCYNTGPVSGSWYTGGFCGISTSSTVYYTFSSGFVKGTNYLGGMAGYTMGSNWVAAYWDYQAAGTGSSATGTAKTTDEMKTRSTYDGWDFSGIWGIFDKTTYPYLLWRYPAAVLLSGTAYSDSGATTLQSGVPVLVVDRLGLSVAHFEGRTDYAGRYSQLVDSGAFLAAVTKTAVAGNSYGREESAQSSVLDVFSKTVFAKTAAGKTIAARDLENVTAAFRTDQVLALRFSEKGLALPSGVPLLTGAGTVFETDRNLTASGGAGLVFNGRLYPRNDLLLSAGEIAFNAGFATTRNLTLNCTGDVLFREATALGGLRVLNARDLEARELLEVGSYIQDAGTGTTVFSGALEADQGKVSIRTASARGRIIAGALSLRTGSALLTGLVSGESGQAGADRIVLLGFIRIGTHYFEGIDLYKLLPEDVTVATEDEPYSVDYQPQDPVNESLAWTVKTGAAWLHMSPASGLLSGTPGNADVGLHEVTVTASDGPRSVSRTFWLEVLNLNDPPQIMTADVPQAVQDRPYEVVYGAVDIDPTHDLLEWSLETDAGWLSLDGSRLHGVPENGDVGQYWVNVSVSDGNGGADSHNFTLTVEDVNDRPVITVEPAATALEDAEYRVAFNASDIDDEGGLTWTVKTAAGWLKMDKATGVLSGTPSNDDIGSYWVEVTVTDDEGGSDTRGFMLTVLNVNDAPAWVSVPADQTLMEGGTLLLDALARDDDRGDTLTYGLSSEPASGMVISPASGAVRWTGVIPGNYSVTLTATDGKAAINHTFNLTVKALPPPVVPPPNKHPKIGAVTVGPARVGQAFVLRLEGSDDDTWDAANLTFRLVSGPSGMIVSADGNLLWIPARDQAGQHTVTVALSDGKNTTTSVFTVEVRKPTAVAASTGFNEGWLLAMVLLGLVIGMVVGAVVLRRRPPPARTGAPPPVGGPPIERRPEPPAAPPSPPPAEPLPALPPPEPEHLPSSPPQPTPAVEKKPPQPDFKP